MIKINLLSPLDKENLKWEKVNNLAVKNILWVFLLQAIFFGTFFFSIEYLKTKSEATAARLVGLNSGAEAKEVASIDRALKQSKSRVASIYEAQTGHIAWTGLFETISVLIPAGVRLEDINVTEYEDTAAKKGAQDYGKAAAEGAGGMAEAEGSAAQAADRKFRVRISGNARTRDLLLALEDRLKASMIFSDLEYDTDNYVKSVDIDFKYTFYIKEKDLIK